MVRPETTASPCPSDYYNYYAQLTDCNELLKISSDCYQLTVLGYSGVARVWQSVRGSRHTNLHKIFCFEQY